MATATSPVTPKAPLKRAPPLSIFDQIRNDPKFSHRRSIDWFKTKINSLGGNSPSAKTDLLKTTKEKQSNIVLPGTLVMYGYDPKTKDTLEYYDKFPCVLVTSLTEQGWVGLNIHYLAYAMRARIFDKLWMIAKDVRNTKQQVLRMNWKLLGNVSKFPEARPAVKQYLYSHLTTRILKVDIEDWKTAMFLPVDSFAKKSQGYVARDSGQKIRKLV
jgi:hypothetical protein